MEKIKEFKTLQDFETELKISLCWEDVFKIGNFTYKLYEYGGGSLFNMDYDFVYFYNKQTKTMIYIKYDCPSYAYKNNVKIMTKQYKFIDLEVLENPYLWREDTL